MNDSGGEEEEDSALLWPSLHARHRIEALCITNVDENQTHRERLCDQGGGHFP